MIFQKKSRQNNKYKFFLGNEPIDTVSEYTYLGMKITNNGSFRSGQEQLKDKSFLALSAIRKKFNISKLSLEVANKLFDSTVLPILTYGAEIWGIYEKINFEFWDKNPIEKMHLRFCKAFLGVNRKASNVACRAEMGRYPIKLLMDIRIYKFYERLKEMDDGSFAKQAFLISNDLWQRGHHSLHNYVSNINSFYGISETSNGTIHFSINKALINIKEKYLDFWKGKVSNSRKLNFYKDIKVNYEGEHYLNNIKNCRLKQNLTKLRISNHNLMIEQGRYCTPYLEREFRFCPLCTDPVLEDEIHFMCDCEFYNTHRENLYAKIIKDFNTEISSKSSKVIATTILKLNNSLYFNDIALFVHNCMKIRSTVSSKLK